MNEKTDRILAKRDAILEQGGRDMWRTIIADTVMALLAADEPVTRDRLRQDIETQIGLVEGRFEKAKRLGALNILNGRAPQD